MSGLLSGFRPRSFKRGKAPQRNKWRLLRRCIVLCGKISLSLVLLTILTTLTLRWLSPPTSSFMIQRCIAGWRQGQPCSVSYRWVDWDAISPHMKLAVVAAEDQKFPHHFGFDVAAMVEAWEVHQGGGRLRGASTISQQVAKNLFLWSGRSVARKALEAYFTFLTELLWPKQRILEVYLNLAEFGDDRFGVAAASQTFFAKLPRQLTPREAALLAAVLPNPHRLQVKHPSAHVRKRQAWILQQMRQLGGTAYLSNL